MAAQPPHPSIQRGPLLAILAAAFFGISTPFGKVLLEHMSPQWLGGLFCTGSGLGLFLWMGLRRLLFGPIPKEAALKRSDLPWLACATIVGGIVAPVLLAYGLSHTPASAASLLLNIEGVFTASIAWWIFREHFDRRILLGMLLILSGSVFLSYTSTPDGGIPWSALGIAGACLCWAIDNNLTRKISAADPVQITALKGLVSGSINLGIAWKLSDSHPTWSALIQGGILGFFSYGLSLVFFVLALRHLGTARTGAYFSTAPFIGTAISILFYGEPTTPTFWIAAALMAIGVLLHLTEEHNHFHRHEVLEHEHLHVHDAHHQHEHSPTDPPGEPHSHWHRHEILEHSHPHYPDIHHQHEH
ncbi:MAG: EamA family transporter [Verrucomicrobiota bacterium]